MKTRTRKWGYRTAAALLSLLNVGVGEAAEVPRSLLPLLERKEEIAQSLAQSIVKCVLRKDTFHAVFDGCMDWHSAVHGTWGLVAFAKATGETTYMESLESKLASDRLRSEQSLLQRKPDFEMPYGRAWFLRVAIDYEQAQQSARLRPMADEVLESIVGYYRGRRIDPESTDYNSASWALVNIYDYASFTKNDKVLALVKTWIIDKFVDGKPQCNLSRETGFMAICTNWAWLASKVLAREELIPWLDAFFRKSGLPTPVSEPIDSHQYGINFSRAWGLWALYEATGELVYVDAYVKHFKTTYDVPSNWRGSYESVGHWIPQFGMFAIQPLFGAKRGR